MRWPGIEPGLPAWQARILPLNWHQCPIKNWLVAFKGAWGLIFVVKREKEKENKTKQSKHTHKTNEQSSRKGKVEKGIQIIQE